VKTCKKCEAEKPLSEYYKHKEMLDGLLNFCKPCVKSRIKKHREDNIERIREYDRGRGNRMLDGYHKEYIAKYPNKYKAHCMVSNAVRDKKLFKEPCEVCGDEDRLHAHHDDYLKPLEVRWLCPAHHRQWHIKNGEAMNG